MYKMNKTKDERDRLGRLKYLMRNRLRSFLRGCLGCGCVYTLHIAHVLYTDSQRWKLCGKLGRSFPVGLGTSSRILRGSLMVFVLSRNFAVTYKLFGYFWVNWPDFQHFWVNFGHFWVNFGNFW